MDGFAHLHVHSHYSLLDGGAKVKDLVKQAKALGMESLAISDHGNLFGAMEFYNAARSEGIKPILGLEAYISPTTRDDRSMGNQSTAAYHLLLLAMNETGWRNLVKLSSRAYMEGFYYKPRVDRQLLGELNEGLICTTACLGGEVPQAFLSNSPQRARQIAGEYRDIFGPERFFIEIQAQGMEEQDRVNPHLVSLASDLGVGVVGTNDVHFLRRQDKQAHAVLTCISTGKTLSQGALEYSPELYLKSPAEMRQALAAWPVAADNTLKIAEMCNVELEFSEHLPVFPCPEGQNADEYLRHLAFKGLRERFEGKDVPDVYVERLERELGVIADKGYSSYFLIVWDFVDYARRNNIPAAPRGSGVGTLLGYALGIADVDPIRYGLLFERFTDPARKEAPDIDIDLCQEGRAKVIQYVRQKYGHVAQIITYGTLKAKAAIRDVGRVLEVPLPEVDAIAKKVPDELKMTLPKALAAEPELKRMYDEQERIQSLIDYGMSLEGLARHAGVHAAGVIIADEPLENIVPLCRQSDSEDAITQWDGPTCDNIGLMKMDFLGLRTLTIIQRARELVAARLEAEAKSGEACGMGVSPMRAEGVSPSEAAITKRKGSYLPHWNRDGAAYAVTFRLADSVPDSVAEGWRREREDIVSRAAQQQRQLTHHERTELHQLYSARIESYLDAGHGECVLKEPRAADLVQEALKHFNGERYHLQAWAVMPNHVHAVIEPLGEYELKDILHSWKSYTAKEINKALGRKGQLWLDEYYDHLIRDEEDFNNQVNYVVGNPAKAGLREWSWCGMITHPHGQDGLAADLEQHGQDAHVTHGQDGHATFDIDPEKLPLDDQEVYELFRKGQTDGVFQFESDGMKGILMQMQPNCIEDLIAANAMYRPGPMELIPTYCSRKHGNEAVPSVHELVDDILAETYGIMCYQEQVMQVLNRLGKLPLNRALTLIKAISKKKEKTIAEERPNFLAGAQENGISADEAQQLFELILKFAGYGFNKSHSTRYAIVAYQTAYFKVHYPREFLAATMTFECSDTDKVVQYIAEAGRMGIKVAPPDINACDKDFTVDGEQVRFGLAAVKGVGGRAVEAILAARAEAGQFTDLYHFCEYVDLRAVNRSTIEALIKCGAFDALGAHRAAMLKALDKAIELGQSAAADRRSGQMNMFAMLGGGKPAKPSFPQVDPLTESELLAAEKETLGFYITSHPLVRYGREIDQLSSVGDNAAHKVNLSRLEEFADGTRLGIGCMIAQVRPTVTKTGRSAGRKMAMMTLEDTSGKADAVVFSEAFERLSERIEPEAMVVVIGSVDRRRERPNIIVDDVIPLEDAVEQLTGQITLVLPAAGKGSKFFERLGDVLERHSGGCPMMLRVSPTARPDLQVVVRTDDKWRLAPSQKLIDELTGLLGEENVFLRPKPQGNGNARKQWKGPLRRSANGNQGVASEAVTRFN
jgi:DNA polymerase III alpha subunit/REP element-mobilizing transposase RayT